MRILTVALLVLLSCIPNSTHSDSESQPQIQRLPPNWTFVTPGAVELHADGNCLSWVILFRQVSDGTWIYTVVPIPRAKCQPHPGEYPDEFLLPWS